MEEQVRLRCEERGTYTLACGERELVHGLTHEQAVRFAESLDGIIEGAPSAAPRRDGNGEGQRR